MFKLTTKIPHTVNLAFSGGVDSLAVAHFLKMGRRKVTLLHFNHGCEYSDQIEAECHSRAKVLELPLIVGTMGDAVQSPGQSLEEFWRRKRYAFLRSFSDPVITCHHLDDAVETWVWSSLHGHGKIIPVQNNGIIRPFLLTKKESFENYAERNNLFAVHDPYNEDYDLTRNYIRANMMQHVRYINPGIDKVVRKKYLRLKDDNS